MGPKSKQEYSQCKLWLYCISLSLGAFQFGYGLGVYNPTSKVLETIYSQHCNDCWDYDKNKEPLNTVVSTTLFVGALIGSALANLFMNNRRIRAVFIFSVLCIIGSAMQLVVSLPMLIIGRFVLGFGAGGFSNLTPMMINEVSPPAERGKTGFLTQIMICFAIFLSAALGLALPCDVSGVQESDILWRIITGLPILVGILTIIIFATCYSYDTPIKYIERGQNDLAMRAIQKVYHSNGSSAIRHSELRKQIDQLMASDISWPQVSEIQSSRTSNSSKQESLGSNPTCILVICVIFSIYQQLAGINAITFYSAQIFSNDDDISDIYQGNRVAVQTTAVNLIVTILTTLFIQKFGRRPLLLFGSGVMTIFMFLTGLFEQLDNDMLEEICILVFIAGFAISMGPVMWLYLPQALNGGGIALSAVFNRIFVVVISIVVPTMSKLKQWMFYIFAIFNVIGFFFILIFIIESKGKTRSQLQMAYVRRFGKVDQYRKLDEKMIA